MAHIKACPICGTTPYIFKESMDQGNGHGYPGKYSYTIKCHLCEIPKEQCRTDVYLDNKIEIFNSVIKAWNEEVERIEKYLKYKEKNNEKIS